MFQALIQKRFNRKKLSPLLTNHQSDEPEAAVPEQLNTDRVIGLHPRVFGDFRNLTGDVSGLIGLVSSKLHGNATGIIGRTDHLSGDITILVDRINR